MADKEKEDADLKDSDLQLVAVDPAEAEEAKDEASKLDV